MAFLRNFASDKVAILVSIVMVIVIVVVSATSSIAAFIHSIMIDSRVCVTDGAARPPSQ